MLRNPCFQLGRRSSFSTMGSEDYSNPQAQALANEINSLKQQLERDKIAYAQIKSKLVNEIEDLPKLSPYERAQYSNLYKSIQRTQRIILEKEPMISVLNTPMNEWFEQPSIDDVIAYADKKNKNPSEVLKDFENENLHVFYPTIAHEKAKQLNNDFIRLMDNSEPFKPMSYKWLDKAIEWLDSNYGNGETPYLDKVLENRLNFYLLCEGIRKFERAYLLDTVNNFLGKPTSTFSKESIEAITNSNKTIADVPAQAPKKIRIHLNGEYDSFDGNMGWGLKSLVKSVTSVALSPIQKLVISPFNKVVSSVVAPVLKTVLPDNLVNALANLSEVQANILAGQISSKNIKQAVKASVVVAGYATGPSAYVAKEQIKLIKKTSIGNGLDKYSGGLLTSAQNLTQMSSDAQAGRKIDVMARAVDALKVGLAVSGGAGALAATVGTNFAVAETPLKNIPMSNTIVKGAMAVSTGSGLSDVATDIAKEKAISTGAKIGVSTGLVNKSQANVLSSVALSMSSGNSAETALTETGKGIAVNKAKNLAVSSGLVSNSMANLVEKGLKADLENSDMSELAKAEAERYVSKQVSNQLDKYGVNLDKVIALSQGDLSSLQKNVAKMEKGDFQSYLQDQGEELQNKFDNERLNLEKKINDSAIQYQNEYSRLYRNYTSPELERQLEALQKKYSDLASQYVSHLENQLAIIQKDFQDGLNKVSKEISKFDPQAMIDDALAKAKKAMSGTSSLFEFNAYDKMYNLVKKYGKDFLLYLLYKYGSQADYDSFITDEDKEAYKTWKPDGIQIKKKSSVAPLLIGAGVIGAFMMIMGGTGE